MEDLVRWSASPCPPALADGLAHELGIPLELAAILIRRGLSGAEDARRFLAADEHHHPSLLGDVADACDLVISHLERGSRIVVHGDYDVDGVCSTAILVGALRDLGGDPAWHIPNRLEDGYGLTDQTVDRLIGAGTGLLITVDCGITCAAEIDRARAGGIDSIVCDHHRPADRLPDCPILHPALGGYPFADLCASAVAHKFSLALRNVAGLPAARHDELDLVALATICDVVPLLGENRRLVRDGLGVLQRTRRPGLRALMRVAGLEPGQLDERTAAFRLGPRINAAGRMQTAEAALELMLTCDEDRAGAIADELDLLNRARRDEETRVLFSAESARAGHEEDRVTVVAGEGWHPGVLGIVASRLAERHGRPALVIALEDGVGRGSGRSWAGFDLHGALSECAHLLSRFGGHRAAAGVELDADRLDAFRTAFESVARARIDERDLGASAEVDAIVSPARLGLDLAESLRLLAPFGAANREPVLVAPGVSVEDVRPMGGDGQHARMALVGGGGRARSVAFRCTPRSLEDRIGVPQDAVLTLEIDRWGGSVSARPILSGMLATPSGWVVDAAAGEGFMDRVRALSAPATGAGGPAGALIDRRGVGLVATAAELFSLEAPILVVCADLGARREGIERLLAGRAPEGRLAACEWVDLLAGPPSEFGRLLALDPPVVEYEGPCEVVAAWGEPEIAFALEVLERRTALREPLATLYRTLRESGGELAGRELEAALRGPQKRSYDPRTCARLLAVLAELELAAVDLAPGAERCRLLEQRPTSLESSATFTAAVAERDRLRSGLEAEQTALSRRRAA